MDAGKHEFHLQEYKEIRGELASLFTRLDNAFRFSLAATAAIYSWMITQSLSFDEGNICLKIPGSIAWLGWVIPLVFIFFSALISFISALIIERMGNYLRVLENYMGHPFLGWEKFVRSGGLKLGINITTITIWTILLLVSSLATWKGLEVTILRETPAPPCKQEDKKLDKKEVKNSSGAGEIRK